MTQAETILSNPLEARYEKLSKCYKESVGVIHNDNKWQVVFLFTDESKIVFDKLSSQLYAV